MGSAMATDKTSVLVIAPAFNEAKMIGEVVRGVKRIPEVTDVLVVDDCSTDNTAEVASTNGALVARHPQNMGVGAAIRTGITFARNMGYSVVAIIAGDGQHDPADLPKILRPVLDGECDLCLGSRFLAGGRVVGQNAFRVWGIRLYSLLFSMTSGHWFTDATNGLRAFRASLLEEKGIDLAKEWLNRYELEPYLIYTAARLRLRIKEVPCTVRYHEKERYSHMKPFVDWWRLLKPPILLRLGLRR